MNALPFRKRSFGLQNGFSMRHTMLTMGLVLTGVNLLIAQKVGINTDNPNEVLHIRTDTNKLAIRMDNKKSASGINYYSVTGIPASVMMQDCAPIPGMNCSNWSGVSLGNLTGSDNQYITSPFLSPTILTGLFPPSAINGTIGKKLALTFQLSSPIPSAATLLSVKVEIEYNSSVCTNNLFYTCPSVTSSLFMINSDTTGMIPFGSFLVFQPTTGDQTNVLTSSTIQNISPDDFNAGEITLILGEVMNQTDPNISPQIKIDRIRIKINYSAPATGDENTFWSAGVKEGVYTVSSNSNLSNPYLTIDETGLTRLKGLQITDDAGDGKVLFSTSNGTAYWGSLPEDVDYWRILDDTLTSAAFPTRVQGPLNAQQGICVGYSGQPVPGNIRYNPGNGDFEGYTGAKWLSFTTNTGFGNRLGHEDQGEQGSPYFLSGEGVDLFQNTAIVSSRITLPEDSRVTFYEYDGSSWLEDTSFISTSYSSSDVAINGDFGAVAGGAATRTFIRTNGNWEVDQVLYYPGLPAFSHHVDISNTTIIVGTENTDTVYTYLRSGNTWVPETILEPTDIVSGDNFGKSVGIFGDYCIAGAPVKAVNGNQAQGAAYIFYRNGGVWTQQAKLTAPDGQPNDFFGRAVHIAGNYAIVGAYSKDVNGNPAQGAAYIYLRNGSNWTLQAQLIADGGEPNDLFGFHVRLSGSGNYAIIGAPEDISSGLPTSFGQGKAFVFQRTGTTWTQTAKLTASDGMAGDSFGNRVAITQDAVLVGAPFVNENHGAIYFYSNN